MTSPTEGHDSGFPKALAQWFSANGELLRSLVALRRLGAEGANGLAAALAIKRVVRLRLSWQLWAALVEGDGGDPEELLLRELSLDAIDHVRVALWGSSWRDAALAAGEQ